jgi:hypothetical protein
VRRQDHLIALDKANSCVVGPAHSCRALRNRIKHRLNVGRRAGDHTQDFARRRLLLQRFLKFLKQPDILNGDDCLISEGF